MTLDDTKRMTFLAAFTILAATTARPSCATASDLNRINFTGGTVTEYIELIRETIPDINVVLMPNAADVQLPPVRLHSWPGNEGVFFNVLEYVTRDSGADELDVSWDGDVFFIRLEHTRTNEELARPELEQRVMSYSLASIIVPEHVSASDTLTNIEQALELAGETDPAAVMRFHEQTNLLIVRGTHHAHSIVRSILSSMQQTADEVRVQIDQKPIVANAGIFVDAERGKQLHDVIGILEQELAKRDRLIERLAEQVRELQSELTALLQRQRQ